MSSGVSEIPNNCYPALGSKRTKMTDKFDSDLASCKAPAKNWEMTPHAGTRNSTDYRSRPAQLIRIHGFAIVKALYLLKECRV